MAEARSRSRKSDDDNDRADTAQAAAPDEPKTDEDRDHLRRQRGMDPELDVIPVADGEDHGYIGQVPDRTPNDAYTVKGVGDSDEAAVADRLAARRWNTAR